MIKKARAEEDNDQMYEVIQQLRYEEALQDGGSSSSDSVSSDDYEERLSPLSSRRNSFSENG